MLDASLFRENGTYLIKSKNIFDSIKISTLSFSDHSGAFRVLNTIWRNPKLEEFASVPIKGVALFDATYGSTLNIENFALKKLNEGKTFLFFDSFISGPKATAPFALSNISQNILLLWSAFLSTMLSF